MNIIGPDPIRADFARWGYPEWFHLLTGALEVVTAGLLMSRLRRAGVAIGAGIMTAAAVTLVVNGEYFHTVAPLVVLTLLGLVWRLSPVPKYKG